MLTLAEIDKGHYAEPEVDAPPLVLAEWLIYSGKERKAVAVIRSVRLTGDLQVRADLIRAEVALWEGRLAEAHAIARIVMPESRALAMRVEVLLLRVATRRGRYHEVISSGTELRYRLLAAEMPFLAAVAAHQVAWSQIRLGRLREAIASAQSAVAAFKDCGATRYEAFARTTLGVAMDDMGQHEAALTQHDLAEGLSAELGIPGDMLWARANACRSLISTGRYDEAVERLNGIESDGSVYQQGAAVVALSGKVIAEGLRGETAAALEACDRLGVLALARGQESEMREAGIYRAWLTRDFRAMQSLVSACDADGAYRAEVRVFLADILAFAEPDTARTLLDAAIDLEGAIPGLLVPMAKRTRAAIAKGAIRIGDDGELILDTSYGVPAFDHAIAVVRRYLVNKALDVADSGAQAARELRVSRSRFHDLRRMVEGRPTRPTLRVKNAQNVEHEADRQRDADGGFAPAPGSHPPATPSNAGGYGEAANEKQDAENE